jgi:pimeloyl-ACP methyl ester carboxylesterase
MAADVRPGPAVRVQLRQRNTSRRAASAGGCPRCRPSTAHGLRVLAFDFRGFPPPASAPNRSADDFAPDLEAAIDASTRTARKVFVVGAPFGGAATLKEARLVPPARLGRRALDRDRGADLLEADLAVLGVHADRVAVGDVALKQA